MSEIQKLTLLQSKPGIRRDGTDLDGDQYSDGKWVRFQRGRPKKMGGYSRNSSFLSGPVRAAQVWSRGQLNNVFAFSGHQIEVVQVDKNGNGSSVNRLTPEGFIGDDEFLWSTDVMFDAAAGSESTIILAVPTKTISNIDDFTEHNLYWGLADGSDLFEAVSDPNAMASGGVFVTSPYAVLYGSDGKVTWSNANEPQNYTTGDAGSARVTGSKIVNGHSLRSGSGASGLLWALDSLLKMEYVGGNAIFRFSKIGNSSILAQNSVIEYDGVFYWIGIDRFLSSNGATIAEINNNTNLNWFFDNLNYNQRQKIWAMKIPRFGEIWWFYPRGNAEECSHAIILNLREQCWYDCELPRSAGFYSQVLRYPIMFEANANRNRNATIESGTVSVGDTIVGSSSGATGIVTSLISDTEIVIELTSSLEFITGEECNLATLVYQSKLYSMFIHEKGLNSVEGDSETAIESYFVTNNLGLPSNQGVNRHTRLTRIEPDFIQRGDMSVEVLSKVYANSDEEIDGPFVFNTDTEKVDLRIQRRHLKLKFKSNQVDGNYEVGKIILWIEPGDLRS